MKVALANSSSRCSVFFCGYTMFPRILLFVTVVSLCLCLIGKTNDYRVKPHTRLLYEAGSGTNIWFFSHMRCKMKVNEDFTFYRYRVIKEPGKVYYENGGMLEVYRDKMVYMGVTNFYGSANGYLLTPTTNFPNKCI